MPSAQGAIPYDCEYEVRLTSLIPRGWNSPVVMIYLAKPGLVMRNMELQALVFV